MSFSSWPSCYQPLCPQRTFNSLSKPTHDMGLKPVKFTHKVRYSFFAFKIFGLSPFADDASPWKTILIAHSLVLLAITLFLLYSAFILTDIFSQSLAGTLASIVGELMFCGLIATNVIILLQALIFRSEGQQIESRFDTIHHLLREKLFVDISAARIQRKLFWKNFSIVVFLVLVIAFNLLALSFYDEPLGYNLHSLWPIVIIRTRCIHNIFLIDLITEHLNGLNGKLEATIAMAEREKESEDSFKIMYAQRDFGHLARTPYSELMTLKDVYGYIWDIANLINDTFGWSLLAVSTQNFLEFTCNGYWLFLATDNKLSGLTAISKEHSDGRDTYVDS